MLPHRHSSRTWRHPRPNNSEPFGAATADEATNQDIAGWQVSFVGIALGWDTYKIVAHTLTLHLPLPNTRISGPLGALFSKSRETGEG